MQNVIPQARFLGGSSSSHNSHLLSPTYVNVKVNQSHYRPEVSRGFQEVKVPTLRDNGTGWW